MCLIARLFFVLVTSSALCVNLSHAGFPQPFYIELDDQSMFVGDTYQPGSKTCTEIVRSQIRAANVQVAEKSMFRGNRGSDVTLNGRILFSIGDLPKMRLRKIRLIYYPQNREHGQYSNGWKLHPDDASAIAAYYEKIEGPTILFKQRFELFHIWSPLLFYGFASLTLITVLYWLRRYRLKHAVSNLLLNSPIDR